MTTRTTLARACAYVGITGRKLGLKVDTRIALYDYADFVKGADGLHSEVLNDAGRALAETSPLWKAHAALVARGFHLDRNTRRQRPSYLHYAMWDEDARRHRTAFIANGQAYVPSPIGSTYLPLAV
jgi:hypothetical protein